MIEMSEDEREQDREIINKILKKREDVLVALS